MSAVQLCATEASGICLASPLSYVPRSTHPSIRREDASSPEYEVYTSVICVSVGKSVLSCDEEPREKASAMHRCSCRTSLPNPGSDRVAPNKSWKERLQQMVRRLRGSPGVWYLQDIHSVLMYIRENRTKPSVRGLWCTPGERPTRWRGYTTRPAMPNTLRLRVRRNAVRDGHVFHLAVSIEESPFVHARMLWSRGSVIWRFAQSALVTGCSLCLCTHSTARRHR